MLRQDKFFGRIHRDPATGCQLWQGGKTGRGYGQLMYDGKLWYAHRLAWTMANGPIPDGQWVLHKCDVPHCVNPGHLFLGNNADNMADKVSKGRNPHGEGHVRSKLTDHIVLEARELWRSGEHTVRSLAERYGVSGHTIYMAMTGKTWKHLAEAE